MKQFYKLLGAGLCGLSLCACSIMPGMTFQNPGNENQQQVDAQTDITPTLIPITPDLIIQMKKTEPVYDYQVGPGDHIAIVIWSQPAWSSPGGAASLSAASAPPTLGTNLLQSGSGSGSSSGGSFGGSTSSNFTNSVSNSQVNDYLINVKGNIFVPYLGNIHVAGMTEDQVQATLVQRYQKYLRDPQITIRVTTFASQQIYVLGEANQQALVALTDAPMNLGIAIADAGGINVNTANPSQIFVIRGDLKKPTIYWLDSGSPTGMLLAQNFTMKNHDIVFISPALAVSWNRVINQVLPTVQAVWYTKSLVNSN